MIFFALDELLSFSEASPAKNIFFEIRAETKTAVLAVQVKS